MMVKHGGAPYVNAWSEDEGSARPAMAGGMRQEMTSTPGTDEVQLLVDGW